MREGELFDGRIRPCPGVELNDETQHKLFDRFVDSYDDLPFPAKAAPGIRYHYENRFFSFGDGIILYSFLRHLRPSRVVEIGSGYSSCVMLDTTERFLSPSPRFTFVDPNSRRLDRLLSASDRRLAEIVHAPVQTLELERFLQLDRDDILFIDSSHVVRIGSDVSYLVFEVLPRLKPGVVVQFHDILWPFEYPREWVWRGYAWNEAYLLRSFLQYNDSFEVLYFNDYFAKKFREHVEQRMPLILRNPGGSLWLRKVR